MPCKSKSKSKRKSTTRSWRYCYKLWKEFMDREFKVANSLSSKTPYGRNPVSGKPLRSSRDFVNRLKHEGAMKTFYKNETKRAYKKQTGKSW